MIDCGRVGTYLRDRYSDKPVGAVQAGVSAPEEDHNIAHVTLGVHDSHRCLECDKWHGSQTRNLPRRSFVIVVTLSTHYDTT